MTSPEFFARLNALESSTANQADKVSIFTAFLEETIRSSPADQLAANLSTFIDTVLSDAVNIVTSRPVLTEFVTVVAKLQDNEIKKTVYRNTLEKLQPKSVSYEEQDCSIREALADIYEADEENGLAAKVLGEIQLNPHQRQISNEFRIKIYIRIMRNLLEDDDSIAAGNYLSRTTHIIDETEDPTLKLHFKLCQARILDSQRQFLNACFKYHQLSFEALIDESERLECLSAAIKCAVLGPAGPLRSRSLGTLYKDDRSPQLAQDYTLLEKMYLDRLLSQKEVDEFAARLRPHQLARGEDGTTVLAKAVVEHNLLAASKLYNNIGSKELGDLLGLSAEKAEEYAARMIEQKRLAGTIDQIDGLIYFDSTITAGGAGAEKVASRQLRRWDEKVAALAQAVENVTSMMQNEYPVGLPVLDHMRVSKFV